ncbi:hypothetical protein N7456_005725 [Penicillium angulare]|uniref:Glutamine amidotransferase n=1 Tax=Penicillium angulare TaxID=116970 RepID=A0A9W9KJW5_9EURO|nr:hypothetical protein N7456_005725 [Penicillium angulare]
MTLSRKPVIIVTAGYYTDTRPYASAIASAGGVPIVLLPGQVDVHLNLSFDGAVLAGGKDVHPSLYGQEFDPDIEPSTDEPRDRLEFAIIRLALERKLPVLGICRGLQLINVFYGGTLHQNLPGNERFRNTIHFIKEPRNYLAHDVTVHSGKLQRILRSTSFPVNSIHNQGIASLGSGLRSTVIAEDGLIEGIESADGQILAVQWHPEELVATQSQATALFSNIVSRARAHSQLSSKMETSLLGGDKLEISPVITRICQV